MLREEDAHNVRGTDNRDGGGEGKFGQMIGVRRGHRNLNQVSSFRYAEKNEDGQRETNRRYLRIGKHTDSIPCTKAY